MTSISAGRENFRFPDRGTRSVEQGPHGRSRRRRRRKPWWTRRWPSVVSELALRSHDCRAFLPLFARVHIDPART